MISSVDSSPSLTQMFIQSRFPEQKEEPLLSRNASSDNEENTSSTPSSSTQSQSNVERPNFSQILQTTVQTNNAEENDNTGQKRGRGNEESFQKESGESDSNSYNSLIIKARYNSMFLS